MAGGALISLAFGIVQLLLTAGIGKQCQFGRNACLKLLELTRQRGTGLLFLIDVCGVASGQAHGLRERGLQLAASLLQSLTLSLNFGGCRQFTGSGIGQRLCCFSFMLLDLDLSPHDLGRRRRFL